MPLADFKKAADVNLWGLMDVSKTFLPLVKKAKGRVVLVGSIAGKCAERPSRTRLHTLLKKLTPTANQTILISPFDRLVFHKPHRLHE